MATANDTVKKVLDNLNQRISSVGGGIGKPINEGGFGVV